MSAYVGKDENYKFCLLKLPNRNGEYLIDVSLENSLSCLKPKFHKMDEKQWTYIYPNKAKALLDYIHMNNN